MADIKVNRQSGDKSKEMERRGGAVARRGDFPSLFSMNPREFFSASPFELMRRFSDEMDRAFSGWGREEGGRMWAPVIDVRQKGDNLVVCADLPGINKEDVKLEVTEDGLVIQGERKQEEEQREEGFYRSERRYGQFYRLIPLPEGANIDQAKASFSNGVLEVVVPVPQQARKRREIAIETGGQTRTAGGGGA